MSDYIEVLDETDPRSNLDGDTLIHTDKILQDLSSKIPPKKKFLDIAAKPRSGGGQKAIFVKRMHFSGRK